MEIEFFPTITKEYILERATEEDIWSAYGCRVQEGNFCSPLRKEYTPSCHFYRSKTGTWRMIDFTGHFHGDWIDYIQRKTGFSYGNALLDAAKKLSIINGAPVILDGTCKNSLITDRPASSIRVKRRDWVQADRDYWIKYGIDRKVLELYHVSPAQRIWINGSSIYLYSPGKEAYIYHFGGYEYKVYFPREKKGHKFRHVNSEILQGYAQLPSRGETLIVTKSLKDVMVLYKFGYSAVAPMSEVQILSEKHFRELSKRFVRIVAFYDFDYAGVKSMNRMKRLYGMQCVWIPHGYGGKDISDLVANIGVQRTQEFINQVKTLLK